jgi:uncharacterized protein YjbJ (UPF0337 family)
MNKDNIKGKVEEVKGRLKREAGEWTDDTKLQTEGVLEETKGKARKAWGNLKEGAKEGAGQVKKDIKNLRRDVEDDETVQRGRRHLDDEAA